MIKLKNIRDDKANGDFILTLVDDNEVEVNVAIPKQVFEWASKHKNKEYAEYGLNLVGYGHYW